MSDEEAARHDEIQEAPPPRERHLSAAASPQDSTPGDWEELDTPTACEHAFVAARDESATARDPDGSAGGGDPPPAPLSVQVEIEPADQETDAAGGAAADAADPNASPQGSDRQDKFPWEEDTDDAARLVKEPHVAAAAVVAEDEDSIVAAPSSSSTPRPEHGSRSPAGQSERPHRETPREYLIRRLDAARPRLAGRAAAPDPLEAEAQALRLLLHAWKRLLGLAACASLPPVTERVPPKPSALRRFCPAVWMLAFLLMSLGSIGLQWARCQPSYLGHLVPPPHAHNTTTEYVCEHSFIWTYLLPRLIYILGYISVFVCWFCIKQPDLIQIVGEVFFTMTDNMEYAAVSGLFIRYCRRDRHLMMMLFVLVVALSVTSTLIGDGVVHPVVVSASPTRPKPAVIVTSEVFTFLLTLIMDSMMFFSLVSYTLSIKYFDLILRKTQTHLASQGDQAHLSADGYVKAHYQKGHRLMIQSQACVSAVILLVLLRVCQGVTLITLDLTAKKPHTESLGVLPVMLAYTLAVYHHLYRCCQLTKEGTCAPPAPRVDRTQLRHGRHAGHGRGGGRGGAALAARRTGRRRAGAGPLAGPVAPGAAGLPGRHRPRVRPQRRALDVRPVAADCALLFRRLHCSPAFLAAVLAVDATAAVQRAGLFRCRLKCR
ncbi:uncharacterized protein LOC119099389 [Pollicipes pollicipes]|uniref:uncharacterized protein LOC119099389 n=1 Tax=Pollicipes pollicipes TaxID=41117 RepID=UPI001884AAD0|nr:uncharacterized protein LOC119099389 [Pollicipes pollicipes]